MQRIILPPPKRQVSSLFYFRSLPQQSSSSAILEGGKLHSMSIFECKRYKATVETLPSFQRFRLCHSCLYCRQFHPADFPKLRSSSATLEASETAGYEGTVHVPCSRPWRFSLLCRAESAYWMSRSLLRKASMLLPGLSFAVDAEECDCDCDNGVLPAALAPPSLDAELLASIALHRPLWAVQTAKHPARPFPIRESRRIPP